MLHVVLLILVPKGCIGYSNFKHFRASLLHVVSFPGIASQAQHGLELLPGMPASSTPQLHVVLLFYATQLHQRPILSKLCCMISCLIVSNSVLHKVLLDVALIQVPHSII